MQSNALISFAFLLFGAFAMAAPIDKAAGVIEMREPVSVEARADANTDYIYTQ